MKKHITIAALSLFSLSALGYGDTTIINFNNFALPTAKNLKEIASKASFNYGLTYLGPSLDAGQTGGATYNRFNSGQDYKGDDLDATSSKQLYHEFSVGYQVSKNVKLSYSYTFQENLHTGVEYNVYNSDGSVWRVNERNSGLDYNNQRLNAFVTNIYSNNYFFLMSNFYYEFPTTEGSINKDMEYGLGIQPTIGIFSSVPGLYHGVKASIERDYYKRQEFSYNCGGFTCTTRNQTMRVSMTGYIGYNINDNWQVDSSITYDWDTKGDQVDDLEEFNHNMDNIFEVGPKYKFAKNKMSIGGKFQMAINDPSPSKTALLGSFSMGI